MIAAFIEGPSRAWRGEVLTEKGLKGLNWGFKSLKGLRGLEGFEQL